MKAVNKVKDIYVDPFKKELVFIFSRRCIDYSYFIKTSSTKTI